jgi:hypothetical protein
MHASQVLLVLLLVLGFSLYKHRRRSKELLVAFMKSEIPLAIEVWIKSQVSVLPALLGARVSVPQVCMELSDIVGDGFLTSSIYQNQQKQWVVRSPSRRCQLFRSDGAAAYPGASGLCRRSSLSLILSSSASQPSCQWSRLR